MLKSRGALPSLALIALLLLLGAQPVLTQATIVVDGTNCTLSQAITAANTPTSCGSYAGSTGHDTIALSANVTLSADLPQVTSAITVEGNGYTIDGGNSYHMFFLNSSGNLTINNVTLTQSRARSGTNNQGGAIYAWQAHVTVTNSVIQNSFASTDGGGIFVSGLQSTLTVSNSTISGNRSGSLTGGISYAGAAATLTHVTLSDNESDGASSVIPSGINAASPGMSIRNSIIASSDANQDCFLGTGVSLSQNIGNLIGDNTCSPAASGDPNVSADARGALLPGSGSPVLGLGNDAICKQYNIDQFGVRRPETGCDAGAVERGGFKDIYVTDGSDPVTPATATCTLRKAITSANENDTTNADGCVSGVEDDVGRDVIWLQTDSTLNTQAPEITSDIFMDGGGHRIVTTQNIRLLSVASGGDFILRDVELSGGNPGSGGGAMSVAGKLWLEDCVIKDNSTTSSADGGAISFASGSNATIDRCAFINNRSAAEGGAIAIDGGSVNIINSTFYKNHSAESGGAIHIDAGTVTLAHLTVWDNTSGGAGYVTGIFGGGSTNLYNSVIGRTTTGAALCGGGFLGNTEERGVILSQAHTNCPQATVANPMLGALTGSIPYLPLQAGSPARGAGIDAQCNTYKKDQLGNARPATGCDVGAVQYIHPAQAGPGVGGGERAAGACTGKLLNKAGYYRVSATYGLCSGVEFQVVDGSGVGIAWIVEAGFIDALDVWGWVQPTVEVCFPQAGSTLFLNAASSPRTVEPLDSYRDGHRTCASIGKAGTVVLMPADSAHTTQASAPPGASGALAECMVTTNYILNLRQTPDGEIVVMLPYQVTLTAFQKQDGWYYVDYLGTRGWVSAAHVTPDGGCD